jgi:hypothetical protein
MAGFGTEATSSANGNLSARFRRQFTTLSGGWRRPLLGAELGGALRHAPLDFASPFAIHKQRCSFLNSRYSLLRNFMTTRAASY